MQSVASHTKRIFGLDLMRSFAILGVLGSHILYIFPEENGGIISLLHLGGVMGVEIFFVLSGYLIGGILLRIFTSKDFHVSALMHFLIRRWFRTLPNYYLVLLLNIILVIAIGRELPESLPLYFILFQNLYYGMDIFFTESWSLPIEEFAYVLGPLVLYVLVFAFAKANRDRLFVCATVGIILTFVVSKIYYNATVITTSHEQWNIDLKAVVFYRIDAVYYGVLAAYLSRRFKDFWENNKVIFALLGFFMFFGFQLILTNGRLDMLSAPFLWNVLYLPVSSISFCLFLPLLSQWKTAPSYMSKPVTMLSIISYAVYLLHYGLIVQTMRWVWPIEELSTLGRMGYASIYFVIVIVVSWGWYRVYEKPMTDLRDKPFVTKYFLR